MPIPTSVKKRFIWFLNTNAFIEFRSRYEKKQKLLILSGAHWSRITLCARHLKESLCTLLHSSSFHMYIHTHISPLYC